MKGNIKNKIFISLEYILKFIIIAILIILEYLSGYKGGLMHHLYYKKMQYLNTIYNYKSMAIQLVIIVVLLLTLIFIYKNKLNKKRKLSVIKFIIYSILLSVGFYLPYVRSFNTYVYILVYFELAILIETIKIVL